jgi:hypothetical protein
MEPEGLLVCSQEPSNGLNPEPDQSSLYNPNNLSKIYFSIFHPPTYWSSQWFLSFWLSHQYPVCILLLHIRATCLANLTLLDLIVQITLGEENDDNDDDNDDNNNNNNNNNNNL